MAADSVNPTRTISLADMTPGELAYLFARMDSVAQAHFFNRVAAETRDWPGIGWCYQCAHIVDGLGDEGAKVVTTLAGHIRDRAIRALKGPSRSLADEVEEAAALRTLTDEIDAILIRSPETSLSDAIEQAKALLKDRLEKVK